ncbi:MAG: hypothetical protein J6K57_07905 [Alistipes sp.]|nr:hypothetical protein [Alistipes sp.]
MKKILLLAAAVAMLAGCSQDLTADLENSVNGSQSVGSWNGEGYVVEASAEDFTRVNTNVSEGASYLTWEAGDEITLVHNGASYIYLAQQAGRSSLFVPKDDANAITAIDAALPVAAFYNVASVDAATMKATFNIAAEQVEGELSNKLPLYGYAASTVVEDNKIKVVLNPLASVVEFELSASSTWNADEFSLARSSRQQYTYASAEGIVVDATTGELDYTTAVANAAVNVKLAAMHDFATKRNVKVVVPNASLPVTSEVTEGEGDAAVTTTVTTHYAPVYHGKGCVKLYKNGVENFRRTIWSAYTPNTEAPVAECKHVYQPLKDILEGHKNGISTAADFKALADEVNYSVETLPAGTTFCNEDGVILLNNSISLAEYTNWLAIGQNASGNFDGVEIIFAGHFDGQGNTISGLSIDYNYADHQHKYTKYDGTEGTIVCASAGLFGVAANCASIKNLTVEGNIVLNYSIPEGVDSYWNYVAGVVGQAYGARLENLTNKVTITSGPAHNNKTRFGGVVGRVCADAEVFIEKLTNEADLNVAHCAGAAAWEIIGGGVVGMVADGSAFDLNIADLTNKGDIVVNSSKNGIIGGVFGYATRVDEKDGIFENCVNDGTVTVIAQAASNIGGIVGQIRHYELLECVNNGAITIGEGYKSSVELYVGGIAGYTNGRSVTGGDVYITDCENNGEIKIDKNAIPMAGGIVGYTTQPVTIDGCLNTANVSVHLTNTNAFHVGGIVGKNGVNSNNVKDGVQVYDCTNEGDISGYTETTESEGGWLYVGGCFGSCYGGASSDALPAAWGTVGCVVDGCVNKGKVRALGGAKFRVGGISGLLNRTDITNCTNEGTVTNERTPLYKEEFFGGIVGFAENGSYGNISGCTNSGVVAYLMPTLSGTGEKTVANNWHATIGGILGRAKDALTKVTNCTFTGKVLGTNDKTHTWNPDTGAWVAPTDFESRNFECRSAIVGACGGKFPISGCTVGGAIGSIKNFDPATGEFEIDQLHPLVDDATSLWHWEHWFTGWTSIPTVTDCVFGN